MIRRLAALLLAVAVFAPSPPAGAQAGEVLRWRLAAGETLRYRQTVEMTTSLEMMGQPMRQSQSQEFHLRWDVREVAADGTARIDQTYERVAMDAEVPMMGAFHWDSGEGSPPPRGGEVIFAAVQTFVGKTISFRLSPDGRVSDLAGVAGIRDEALAAIERLQHPMAGLLREQIGGALSDEVVAQGIASHTGVLPGEPMGPGDRWPFERSTPLPMVGRIRTEGSCILERFDGRTAIVAESGSLAIEEGGREGILASVRMTIGDGSAASGIRFFDLDRGILTRHESETSLRIRLAIDLPRGQAPQGVPDTIDSTGSIVEAFELQGEPAAPPAAGPREF